MLSLNKVLIAGRITVKPVLRKTTQGASVTDLLIALNGDYLTHEGHPEREVCFVTVLVWGKQAENCVLELDISSPVMIEGRLDLDTWFSKEGDKRSKLRIAAERVLFLEKMHKLERKNPSLSKENNSQSKE